MNGLLRLLMLLIVIKFTTTAIITRENVIFQQLDVVSTTSSHWKITFVSDMLPFKTVTDKLYKAQEDVRYHLLAVLKRYDIPTGRGIYHAFEGHKKELDALRALTDELYDTVNVENFAWG